MATNTKSPAELKKEGEELKTLFAKVKKKQHNCAILMSKDGVVIEAHIKKSPEILLKAAKKNGGMPKGVWGTMTMDGQIIKVDPINDKVPGNLAKQAKMHFAARGLKLRLEVLGAEENEEGKAAAQDTRDPIAAESGRQKEALESRLADTQDKIDVLQADTENVMFSALQEELSAHKRAMDNEEYERATTTLDALDGVLKDYADILAEKDPLQARLGALSAAMERVKKGDNSEAADEINRLGREFDYALANNEWVGAADRLNAIEQLTQEHTAETGQNTPNESTDQKPEGTTGGDDKGANEQQAKDKLVRWIDDNKKDINAVLRDKNSAHEKELTKWIVAYQKALKGSDFNVAQQAQNKISDVLEAHTKQGKLSAEQKSAIFDELKGIEEKLSKLVPHIKF